MDGPPKRLKPINIGIIHHTFAALHRQKKNKRNFLKCIIYVAIFLLSLSPDTMEHSPDRLRKNMATYIIHFRKFLLLFFLPVERRKGVMDDPNIDGF